MTEMDMELQELRRFNEQMCQRVRDLEQVNELLAKEIALRDDEMKSLKEQTAWQMGEIVRLRRMVEASING